MTKEEIMQAVASLASKDTVIGDGVCCVGRHGSKVILTVDTAEGVPDDQLALSATGKTRKIAQVNAKGVLYGPNSGYDSGLMVTAWRRPRKAKKAKADKPVRNYRF